MALFTIKPSRGTVTFFVLLLVGLTVRYVWGRRERFLTERDAPPVHTVRRLLRCAVGRDVQRLLSVRPSARDAALSWERAITRRLRYTVATHWSPEWPARCVPIAERLIARSRASRQQDRWVDGLATAVRNALVEASRDRMRALELTENGTLGSRLANLALAMIEISSGAERGWDSFLPPDPTDLYPVRMAETPLPVPLPPEVDYATLVLPDLVLYQSAVDRRLHVVTFDAHGRVRTDRAIGPGAPVRGSMRDGAVLIADDEGDSVFLPGGEPAQRVPLPVPLRNGTEGLGEWQIALTPSALWLLTEDHGTLRLRTTGRSGEVHWMDVALPAAWATENVGGLLVPGRGDSVNVVALRRNSTEVWIEHRNVRAAHLAEIASRDGSSRRRRAEARTARTEISSFAMAPWSAVSPAVRSCVSGAVYYLLATSNEKLWVVPVVNNDGSVDIFPRIELNYVQSGVPGGRFELTCNQQGALLYADFRYRPGTLVYFPRGAHRAVILSPPTFGRTSRVVGGALMDAHGVVALVDHGAAIRVYRVRDPRDGAGQWEGGTLLTEQRSTAGRADRTDPEGSNGSGESMRRIEVSAIAAEGDRVALLAWVEVDGVRYVGRLFSHDGGETWQGE